MSRDLEDYTKKYSAHMFEKYQVLYRRKKVLEILNKYNPKNILEIGCGDNPIFESYNNYKNFVCIEPAEMFYQEAVNFAKGNDKIEVINDFLENKEEYLTKKKFDFIICSSLLHEVENPIALLKKIKNIATKDSIIHLNVPNNKSFHLLWAYKSGLFNNYGELTPTANKLQQHTTFNIDKLKKYIKEAGLCSIEEGSYFLKPFNHSKMEECLEKGILNETLLDGLYNMTQFLPELGSEIYVNCRVNND